MKFLCIGCDTQMSYEQHRQPGDGTFTVAFACASCGHRVAMLANPMESRLVESLGVQIGGRTLDPQPLEHTRRNAVGREDAFEDAPPASRGRPLWTPESRERLQRVPGFVRGMVRKIYSDWAAERGIAEITPAVMDEARSDLGLEGM